MKTKPLIFLLFLFPLCSISQKYFQQKLIYEISVRLDTTLPSLSGSIVISYTNNSNDTLNKIYFLLHPNSTSHRTKTALAKQLLQSNNWALFFSQPSQRGRIDSLNFIVENEKARFIILSDTPDVGILYLNKPLLPNQSIKIETPFFVKIPTIDVSRMCMKNNIYSITQWYPKPAVYDTEGWHPYPYLEYGEFYGEFAKYTVHIEVPNNYTVAATGHLITKSEISRIEQIVLHKEIPTTSISKEYKRLTYIQDSVHDFAWFASPNFLISKDSVNINNRTVYCWAFYTAKSQYLWKNAARYVADAVQYYSSEVGPYPYSNCTAVETPDIIDGGMEYPTITNIGTFEDELSLKYVILHEVGHNWFYGILASNERKYPWIDEGINSFYDKQFQFQKKPIPKNDWILLNNMLNFDNLPNSLLTDYFYFAGTSRPIGLHSQAYTMIDYFYNVYYNTANTWFLLKHQIGDSSYTKFIQSFYRNYAFKHIYPHTISQHINKFTQCNTQWFFDDYLYTTKRSNYKIKKIISQDTSLKLIIKNKNNVHFPYTLTLYNNHQPIFHTLRDGKNFDTINVSVNFDKAIINEQLYNNHFYEHNYQNNIYYHRNILPRLKKPSLRIGGLANRQETYDIFVFPIVSFTEADNTMSGILFYSPVIPYAPLQLRILPLYSFSNKHLNLNFITEYITLINKKLTFIKLSSSFKTFSLPNNRVKKQWQQFNIGIELPFRFHTEIKKIRFTPFAYYISATYPYSPFQTEQYFKIGFDLHDKLFIYPTNVSISNEWHKDYTKISFYANCFFPYNEKKKGILIEYFYGTFLFNNSRFYLYNFFLSGRQGVSDYTYEENYINRFEPISTHEFWSHQFQLSEGMFATYTPIQTNRWMTSLRTSIAFPIPPPIYWYFTIATYHKAGKAWTGSTLLPYESGIEIRFIKHIFAVYFPVIMSNDVKQLSDNYSRHYFDKVRFMLRFRMLNPFNYANKLHEFF
ncbi:MAG: M1 family metallopeptidase [Bacteroidales bacterium]|nr:M1 family metallopeptidase [Bacteroidales bacterium]